MQGQDCFLSFGLTLFTKNIEQPHAGHTFFLLFVICMSWSPSLPSHLSIMRTLSSSSMLWPLGMKMFFASITKLCTSFYLSAAFQLNVGCFSSDLPILGISCTGLAVFTELSASVTTICLPESWASLVISLTPLWLSWVSEVCVLTVYVSFSSAWFYSVMCIVPLFMPFHSITHFTVFVASVGAFCAL